MFVHTYLYKLCIFYDGWTRFYHNYNAHVHEWVDYMVGAISIYNMKMAWTFRNKVKWNFNQNTKLFIHENAPENIVGELAAIFARERWVETVIFRGVLYALLAKCSDVQWPSISGTVCPF